jgi:hypothetical protein
VRWGAGESSQNWLRPFRAACGHGVCDRPRAGPCPVAGFNGARNLLRHSIIQYTPDVHNGTGALRIPQRYSLRSPIAPPARASLTYTPVTPLSTTEPNQRIDRRSVLNAPFTVADTYREEI